MSERTYEVRPLGVEYVCDSCNTGVMIPTGLSQLTSPQRWEHRCAHCGVVQTLFQTYPTIRWERLPAD